MPTTDADRAHQTLSHEECLRLLGSTAIGRLAYTQAALPAVRPVSFTLSGEEVLIPVRVGSALADAVRGAVVAFEADVYDDVARTGWTVTVVGPSCVLEGRPPARTLDGAARPGDPCLIAVHVGLVRGWRTSLPG